MKQFYKFIVMSLVVLLVATTVKAIDIIPDVVVKEAEAAALTKDIEDENIELAVEEESVSIKIDKVSDIAYGSGTIDFTQLPEVEEQEETTEDVKKEEPVIEVVEEPVNNQKSKYNLSEYEIYELAKIVMCEAEGESQSCKEYVVQVILNRISSKKFPNTVHGVIFDGHQFTPTFDGRWEQVEPTNACYDAIYTVLNSSTPLTNALYFETCSGESWHSRNLTQVATISNTRFYVE